MLYGLDVVRSGAWAAFAIANNVRHTYRFQLLVGEETCDGIHKVVVVRRLVLSTQLLSLQFRT